MFGGVQSAGPSEAWYCTSPEIELALLSNMPLIGGTLDLFKCFDQILRSLLYAVLRLAGLPDAIIVPFVLFQEYRIVYKSFGGTLGMGHKHDCGIPQGCHFSMVLIDLLLRPWMVQIGVYGAIARTLADDLLVLVSGPRVLSVFTHVVHLTMVHLHDFGGRIAPTKSKIFATIGDHRRWLQS